MSVRGDRLARQADSLLRDYWSEDHLQAVLVREALALGFVHQFHVLRARVKGGRWVTNTSAKGVPDLWLLHPTGRLVVFECKAPDGKTTQEQKGWVTGLQRVGGNVGAWVVYPKDLDAAVSILRGDTGDTVSP